MDRRVAKIEEVLDLHQKVHKEQKETIDGLITHLRDLRVEFDQFNTNFSQ